MSLNVPIAEWLERHAGNHGVSGSIPGRGIYFHLEFPLKTLCSHLGEAYTNEIKHNIHPE